MRYLMLVMTDPEPDTDGSPMPDIDAWVEQHDQSGERVLGNRLRPAEDATGVRIRNGELLITDGPFSETKDWIAGFDVLDCADLDQAMRIAAGHPMARAGRLELRPFWPLEED